MKNRLLLLILSITLFLMVIACGSQSSTQTQDQSASTPGGPCYNILFPFVPGYEWIYQFSDGQEEPGRIGISVDQVEGTQARINSLNMSTGIASQSIAVCDDGAITNFPALVQSMLIGNEINSTFDVEYTSGVFSPTEETFIENDWLYTWESEYILTGTIQAEDEGEQVTITVQDTPIHLTWQTTGSGDDAFESVTVPAGTYDRALKIERVLQGNVSVNLEGMNVTGLLNLETTQWHEPYLGMIKSQIDSVDFTYQGVKYPIAVRGTIELVDYNTTQ